jgi:hypothetical protein
MVETMPELPGESFVDVIDVYNSRTGIKALRKKVLKTNALVGRV